MPKTAGVTALQRTKLCRPWKEQLGHRQKVGSLMDAAASAGLEQYVLPLRVPGLYYRMLGVSASGLGLRPRREGGRAGQVAAGFC